MIVVAASGVDGFVCSFFVEYDDVDDDADNIYDDDGDDDEDDDDGFSD